MNLRCSSSFALVLVIAVLAACNRGPGESPAGAAPSPEPAQTRPDPSGAGNHEGMPETVQLTSAAIAEAGVDTWKVRPVNLEHLLVLNGTVNYNENKLLHVGANVRGRAVSIPVDLGARVRQGDILVTIESVELGRSREEFVRELSALHVSTRAYDRAKALVEAKAISAGEFQAREGDYFSKKAAVDSAERTLHLLGESQDQVERLRALVKPGEPFDTAGDGATLALRAPFAGRVIERKVTPGALFEALQPLLTLADLSTLWVFLQAYEKDLALLREGVTVTIRSEAWPQETFPGKVDFIGSVVDSATRTVRVRATISNRNEKLRPGMFVRAQVDVPQAYEGKTVLVVPQSALQTLEGRTMVFVQTGPGVFARRAVETGHSFEGFTEVYSGVKADEVVVTEGSFVLKSEFAKGSLEEAD